MKKATLNWMSCGTLFAERNKVPGFVVGKAVESVAPTLTRLHLLWKKKHLTQLDKMLKPHGYRRKGEIYFYKRFQFLAVSLKKDSCLELMTYVDEKHKVRLELTLRLATSAMPYFLRQHDNLSTSLVVPRLRVRSVELPGYTPFNESLVYVTSSPDQKVLEFVRACFELQKLLLEEDLKVFEKRFLGEKTPLQLRGREESHVIRRGSCYS